jgi:hypothetical protein
MQTKLHQRQKLICIDGKMAFYIAYMGETIKKSCGTKNILRAQETRTLPFLFSFWFVFAFHFIPLFLLLPILQRSII